MERHYRDETGIRVVVSILDMNGRELATKSDFSHNTAVVSLNVDIDNPEKEVIYDFWSDTATIR